MWSGMVAFFVGVMRFLSPRWGLIRNDFFSAGVPLHSTACLQSFVPTGLCRTSEPRRGDGTLGRWF